MAEKALTDIAADRFAGDEGFMVQDLPAADGGEEIGRLAIVIGQAGSLRPLDFPNELAAHAPEPGGPTTVDDALAVRRTLARRRR